VRSFVHGTRPVHLTRAVRRTAVATCSLALAACGAVEGTVFYPDRGFSATTPAPDYAVHLVVLTDSARAELREICWHDRAKADVAREIERLRDSAHAQHGGAPPTGEAAYRLELAVLELRRGLHVLGLLDHYKPESAWDVDSVRSDAHGRFRFRAAPGAYFLRVGTRGWAPVRMPWWGTVRQDLGSHNAFWPCDVVRTR
jgi:hypothetical protein